MTLALAIMLKRDIGQTCLALIERHHHDPNFLQETVQLAQHRRMFAGAHYNMDF